MSKDLIPRVTLAGSRRTFLHRSAVVLGGALLGGPAFAAKQVCRLTESEIVGPFYRFGAPFRSQLAGPDEPGDQAYSDRHCIQFRLPYTLAGDID